MNLATKRYLTLVLLGLLFCRLAAVQLTEIKASDAGRRESKITFTLSESNPYMVSVGEDNKSFKVVFIGVENQALVPDYVRLSPVIDRITSTEEDGSAVVEIRTMRSCNYSDYKLGRRVYLMLEFIEQPAPRVRLPQSRPVRPKAAVQVADTVSTHAETTEPESTAVVAQQDTIIAQEAPKSEAARPFPILWLIIAAAVLVVLVLLILVFRRKPKSYDYKVVTEQKATEPEPLEQVSPVLSKMAKLLADQGWTVAEIAAELNVPESTVKQLIEHNQP